MNDAKEIWTEAIWPATTSNSYLLSPSNGSIWLSTDCTRGTAAQMAPLTLSLKTGASCRRLCPIGGSDKHGNFDPANIPLLATGTVVRSLLEEPT